jgi:hypothetical protein
MLLPSAEVDSDESYPVAIDFFFDESPVVLIRSEEPLPRAVLTSIIDEALSDLPDDGKLKDLYSAAEDVRWCLRELLRRRIRQTEESVRHALNDEDVTAEDYAALREYAVRLARVEKLVGQIPLPQCQDHRPPPTSLIPEIAMPDHFPQRYYAVAEEAREAMARLSGLISTQQVVLAQRQAAEGERFQRLLTLVGTAVLVPGLVASVFGANVAVPGQGTKAGFVAMLLFMAASGLGSYVALRAVEQIRQPTTGARAGRSLVLLATTAVVCAAAGVVVLLHCV